MCTINMTFNVPEAKAIDVEALKKQINDLVNVILSRPSVLIKETHTPWTDQFRGKWQDDIQTAEEFVSEIRKNRNCRDVVDL